MPTRIHLSPITTPQQCIDEKMDVPAKPDGTGLQILFDINGSYYVIAGPRGGKILTVNGGKIENQFAPFLDQHIEELDEETFDKMRIVQQEDGIKLLIGNELHPLTFLEKETYVDGKKEVYAYVTFTAICKTLNLQQLNHLAEEMTPTAAYWNQLGNFLFTHFMAFNKDRSLREQASFQEYWKSNVDALRLLTENMALEASNLGHTLLVTPAQALQQANNEDALQKMIQLATQSYADFSALFSHTVGRYSERSGYHVFNAHHLLDAAKNPSTPVKDVNGNEVATGLFNARFVEDVYPGIVGLPIPAPNLSPRSSHIALNLFQPLVVEPDTTLTTTFTPPSSM